MEKEKTALQTSLKKLETRLDLIKTECSAIRKRDERIVVERNVQKTHTR